MSFIPSQLNLTSTNGNAFNIIQNNSDTKTTVQLPSELVVTNSYSNDIGINIKTLSGSKKAFLNLVCGSDMVEIHHIDGRIYINAPYSFEFTSANNHNLMVTGTSDIATADFTLNTVGVGLDNLTTSVNSGANSVTSLQTDVGTLQADVGTLTTDVGTLTTDVGALTTDVGTLTTDVGTLTTDVGTLTTDVGTLQAANAAQVIAINALIAAVNAGFAQTIATV